MPNEIVLFFLKFDLFQSRINFSGDQSRVDPVRPGEKFQTFFQRQVIVEVEEIMQIADVLSDGKIVFEKIVASDLCRPTGGPEQRSQDSQEGGFPAPFGPMRPMT